MFPEFSDFPDFPEFSQFPNVSDLSRFSDVYDFLISYHAILFFQIFQICLDLSDFLEFALSFQVFWIFRDVQIFRIFGCQIFWNL